MTESRGHSLQVQLTGVVLSDLDSVEQLLCTAALPLAGLRAQFPGAYAAVRQAGEIVGVAGLELYGTAGLLRSVAVAPAQRSMGLGSLLVRDRLARAREAQLSAVYLLTTTATDYFARFHFAAADRAAVPETLATSTEFAEACPVSAACLVWSPGA
jgi:N-acetylglutamate synthase-like GNAT family acetyltransferase